MIIKRTLSLVILLSTVTVTLPAQRRWTLDDCISYAQQSNIALKKHELAVQQQEADLKLARQSWQPTVGFNMEYDFGNGNLSATSSGIQLTATDPYTADYSQAALQFEMPLLDGSLLKYRQLAANFQLEASMQNLSAARQDLSIRIASCYFEAAYFSRLLNIANQEVESDRLLLERNQKLYDQDACSKSDVAQTRSLVQADELQALATEEQYRTKLLQLAQVIGLDDVNGFAIDTTDVISQVAPKLITDETIDFNPRILSATAQLGAAKELLNEAKRELYPKLTLFGMLKSYYYHIYSDMPVGFFPPSFGSQLFDKNPVELFGVRLSVPIWTAGRQQNAVKKARLNVTMKQYDIDDSRQHLYHELQQIQEQVSMADKQYSKAVEQMHTASESCDFIKEGYEAGHKSLFDYEEAKARLLSARMNVEKWKTTKALRSRILDFYLNY